MQKKAHLEPLFTPTPKQLQRLMLSPQMQQALHLLQLPLLELSSLVEEELTQNPLLELEDQQERFVESEYEPPYYRGTAYSSEEKDPSQAIENTFTYQKSLFEVLLEQAHEQFTDPLERRYAEALIGNLDQRGLLTTPLEEIAALTETPRKKLLEILERIQSFEPAGIAARSVQEALLLQLKARGKEGSLAFQLIAHHYEAFIQNRLPLIAKSLNQSIETLSSLIKDEIAPLSLHPASNFLSGQSQEKLRPLVADLTIHYSDEEFLIEIHDDYLPNIRLNTSYLPLLRDTALPLETRSYIHEKISSGKWLLRNLHERHQTLYRIAEQLTVSQGAFLRSPRGQLVPLTMKEIAAKLDLHESTIARAVAHKYLRSCHGILPLRTFFTHAYTTESGENISAQTIKQLLAQWIEQEDKSQPLSDDTLSARIQEHGISCARRTVAKYRGELGIGNSAQRKWYV